MSELEKAHQANARMAAEIESLRLHVADVNRYLDDIERLRAENAQLRRDRDACGEEIEALRANEQFPSEPRHDEEFGCADPVVLNEKLRGGPGKDYPCARPNIIECAISACQQQRKCQHGVFSDEQPAMIVRVLSGEIGVMGGLDEKTSGELVRATDSALPPANEQSARPVGFADLDPIEAAKAQWPPPVDKE